MRLFLASLALLSLPSFAVPAYKNDLYQERFLFGELVTGRFVRSDYSQPMDTVRFSDCLAKTGCERLSPELSRQDLRKLHIDMLFALENEFWACVQRPKNMLASFFAVGPDRDTQELGLLIAQIREDHLENWILNRPGNPFERNFRSKDLYARIVKVMKDVLNKPLPSGPVFEADSDR